MKVAIPTLGESGLEEKVSSHFGRAPTFTIVDTENDEVSVVKNTSEHMGGSGKPPEHMAEEGIEVMLCGNLGPKAVDMFESYGIEVFVGGGSGNAKQCLEKWKNGELQEATDKNACQENRHEHHDH